MVLNYRKESKLKKIISLLAITLCLNLSARELTFSEKTTLINYKKINFVKNHVLSKIVVDELSLGEFLSYKVLKNSCSPLDQLLEEVNRADSEYDDQTKRLATLVSICSQGVIGLSELSINQTRK